MNGEIVVVKSGGDIASGVIQKLHRVGFRVLVLEIKNPTSIRRTVSFSQAVYTKKMIVEDTVAILAKSLEEIFKAWEANYVPIVVDELGEYIEKINPMAVVDVILAKKNIGMGRNLAPITVAVGPGFEASKDVDVVIESNRGHNLGRLIFEGFAEKNTGKPGNILGYTMERVLYSPADGIISLTHKIGDVVKQGDVLGEVNGQKIISKIDGLIRGLISDGVHVPKGFKIGDVDPRLNQIENCYTISDKARAIAGGVLEAIMIEKLKRDHKFQN